MQFRLDSFDNLMARVLDEAQLPGSWLELELTERMLIDDIEHAPTTLAALLNDFNENKSVHIVTLEDPVEFVHPQKKATFNQRELGTDFNSFSSGLRADHTMWRKVIAPLLHRAVAWRGPIGPSFIADVTGLRLGQSAGGPVEDCPRGDASRAIWHRDDEAVTHRHRPSRAWFSHSR